MRRSMMLAAVALGLLSGSVGAQPRIAAPGAPRVERQGPSSLRGHVGVPNALRLLASYDFATRVRGIERLAAIGTTEAIDALVDAMDGSVAARDPRARLVAVRALSGEAGRENVRQFLYREMTESPGADGLRGAPPLASIVRGTAALALARSGDKKAIHELVTSAQQTGPAAEAALLALRAYPPASLEPFLEGHKRLAAPLATFLGELGDLRAIDRLHAMLTGSDLTAKIAAGTALAKLGDEAALPVARGWLKRGEPRVRRAAAEMLVDLDAPEAPAAVAALLESESLRNDGLRLALRAPAPALAPVLAKVLPDLPAELRGSAVAALGRAGGLAQLVPLLDKPDTMVAAAFAIATAPGAEARSALGQALAAEGGKSPERRRLLVRAAVVRALVLDDAPPWLERALRALAGAKAPADRAAGAFGLTALGMSPLADVLKASCGAGEALACDEAAAAAARGALALPNGTASLEPLVPWLERAAAAEAHADEALAVAFGAALLAHPDGGDVPTSVLAAWADAGGPLAPVAARALPARDDEALRGRIKRLLEGTDPVVRAHVALGLGKDPVPDAVALLVSAYRFEDDAAVRRAIVRGLSLRTEVQRESTLVLARDLDPDAEVRALARAALAGRTLDLAVRPATGIEPRRSVAWVTIEGEHETDGAAKPDAREGRMRARVVRADGLAVPVVTDPDGVLLVPGLVAGTANLQLDRVPPHPKPFEIPEASAPHDK